MYLIERDPTVFYPLGSTLPCFAKELLVVSVEQRDSQLVVHVLLSLQRVLRGNKRQHLQ